MRIARRLRTFARLGVHRQALFIEALVLVVAALVATRVLPFRIARRLYGTPRIDADASPASTVRPSAEAAARIGDVRWALRMVHERLGWDRSCLLRAIAGRVMLRRRGHRSTLYLGARHDDAGSVKLHAWLYADGVPVSGVRDAHGFKTLGIFDA